MGLSQSLYTGWSGLTSHQRSMDNTGNNLANVNTVGFRQSDYMFSSIFKKSVSAAIGGDNRSAGTGVDVGLGTTTGAILNNFRQGPSEQTGNPLDCYINGNGFFMANTSSGMALTRNGSFYLDHTVNPNERLLCVGDGLPVQGWMAQNGIITPSQNVGNIYLPAIGDKLAGRKTTTVDFRGILPTNTTSSDFNGRETTKLELKGNLSENGGNTLTTHIFAPVTQTNGVTTGTRDEVQEIKVQIQFHGPTQSEDGSTSDYTWTMTTVDWPNPGDPGIQIYPTAEDPSFANGTVSFHNQSSLNQNHGAGEAASDKVTPGSTRVRSVQEDGEGNTVTTFFNIPADFSVDVSRLTNLATPPSAGGLETWYVNGNPKGTMARTVNVFDEYTDFEAVEDASGNSVMQAVRKVETRQNTLYFTKTESDNSGTSWSWRSSLDDTTGSLRFDTSGDLVSSTQSGGDIAYSFDGVRYINQEGALQISQQDGYRDGNLKEITIDQNGKIWGHYSNDVAEALAQLAIGTVPNLNGLSGVSGTLFYPGAVSGDILVGIAGDAVTNFGMAQIGAGKLTSGALEGSNVDLSREFTNLIQIERGYQFNSRVVSTSDELLQTALQLKR